jgi:hypothetical protein
MIEQSFGGLDRKQFNYGHTIPEPLKTRTPNDKLLGFQMVLATSMISRSTSTFEKPKYPNALTKHSIPHEHCGDSLTLIENKKHDQLFQSAVDELFEQVRRGPHLKEKRLPQPHMTFSTRNQGTGNDRHWKIPEGNSRLRKGHRTILSDNTAHNQESALSQNERHKQNTMKCSDSECHSRLKDLPNPASRPNYEFASLNHVSKQPDQPHRSSATH